MVGHMDTIFLVRDVVVVHAWLLVFECGDHSVKWKTRELGKQSFIKSYMGSI